MFNFIKNLFKKENQFPIIGHIYGYVGLLTLNEEGELEELDKKDYKRIPTKFYCVFNNCKYINIDKIIFDRALEYYGKISGICVYNRPQGGYRMTTKVNIKNPIEICIGDQINISPRDIEIEILE